MEVLDTPLTRQKKKFDEELFAKDQEIAELKFERAKVRGVNDLLRFELNSLEDVLKTIQKSLDEVKDHARALKENLPEISR